MTYVWIGLGAAIGANLRYLVGRLMATWLGAGFPWGTLTINVTGSFLIGVIATLLGERLTVPGEWRIFLVVGLLGGYTTFSSFSLEAVVLFNAGRWLAATGYILASVLLGVLACVLGIALVRADVFGS
ncbi:MAG: fluoride efflux transporter CrcB [Thermomicrobiales bacterium]